LCETSIVLRVCIARSDAGNCSAPGRGGVLDQHRNEKRAGFEGKLDFTAHVVGRIVEAPDTRLAHVDPVRPDDDQHGGRADDRVLDRALEVLAGFERVDVPENSLRAEVVRQAIEQAPSRGRRVRPAVTEEDLGQLDLPRSVLSSPLFPSSPRPP
jgi:hypothetical protein